MLAVESANVVGPRAADDFFRGPSQIYDFDASFPSGCIDRRGLQLFRHPIQFKLNHFLAYEAVKTTINDQVRWRAY